jgi:hypothetical protein
MLSGGSNMACIRIGLATAVGCALGVVACILIAAVPAEQSKAQQPPLLAPSEMGRFQIVINPAVRADTFLLDTSTGQTWRPVTYTDLKGEPTVWKYEERVDDRYELEQWWDKYIEKTTGSGS